MLFAVMFMAMPWVQPFLVQLQQTSRSRRQETHTCQVNQSEIPSTSKFQNTPVCCLLLCSWPCRRYSPRPFLVPLQQTYRSRRQETHTCQVNKSEIPSTSDFQNIPHTHPAEPPSIPHPTPLPSRKALATSVNDAIGRAGPSCLLLTYASYLSLFPQKIVKTLIEEN